jgi:nitrogen fixation protein FixH
MTVSVKVTRPATETGSTTLALREAGPGEYVAATSPLRGAWDLDVTATDRQGRIARADRRLILP